MKDVKIPIVCIVGKSGSGKTTVLARLIPEFVGRGLKVGTVKHHKGDFEFDMPGKDSWTHKRAGAAVSLVSSPKKIGMVMDVDQDAALEELVPYFRDVDVVLAEGYKHGKHPKVEVFRPEVHPEPVCRNDGNLLALVCDKNVDLGAPRFATTDSKGLARFLIARFELGQHRAASSSS